MKDVTLSMELREVEVWVALEVDRELPLTEVRLSDGDVSHAASVLVDRVHHGPSERGRMSAENHSGLAARPADREVQRNGAHHLTSGVDDDWKV